MFALHIESLTRRYLLHRVDLLEGLLGFSLGTFRTLKGRGKLGLSHLQVKLQRLVLRHERLQLLLHLAHPSLVPLSLGALPGRLFFGLGERLLQGRHLGRGPWQTYNDPVI